MNFELNITVDMYDHRTLLELLIVKNFIYTLEHYFSGLDDITFPQKIRLIDTLLSIIIKKHSYKIDIDENLEKIITNYITSFLEQTRSADQDL